jgi:hypothetical protein
MNKKTILLMLVLIFISTNALSQNIIHGRITGDVQAGISVELYKTSCGGDALVGTFTTNSEGYYAFGCLDNGDYMVVPDNDSYVFAPEFDSVQIPQTVILPYNFTATEPPPSIIGTWFNAGFNQFLTFYGDGSFWDPNYGEETFLGTYTISGNQITFIDYMCGTDEGIYTYSINENILNFVLISDICIRSIMIPGDWERVGAVN